jgi:hypothetical protein
MKRFTILATIGILAAFTGGSASASAAGVRSQTLQFTSITKRMVFTPPANRTTPPQVGGRLIFEDVMYNRVRQFGKPSGARSGSAEGVCTFIHVGRPGTQGPPRIAAQCVITAHAPNGEVVVVGEGDPGGKVMHYAITGGVGAYANARGTVTSTTVNDEKTLVVVKLTG